MSLSVVVKRVMNRELLHNSEVQRVERERDLYLQLLNLGRQDQLMPFLKEALALIVELGQARQGYLELHDDDEGDRPKWWIAHGFSDQEVEHVRAQISQGIIGEAMATGKAQVTESAVLDPRFNARESIRRGRIEAVLCAPIGEDPPRGVLYLQGPSTSSLFSDEGQARAGIFAGHLAPLVDRLLTEQRRKHAEDPTRTLRETLRLPNVVGRSAAFATVLKQIALVAPLDVRVLLTGESGTGKSQLARVIHENGPRAGQPFLEVNVATFTKDMVEKELFGHAERAFTGAGGAMPGKVAAAEHGTLLLDEIGELPLDMQAKLLQFLNSKEYFPVGGTKAVRADVRLIAATNCDLRRAVAEHRFREDLFFRLEVIPIRVPSLAERRDDIRELAIFFCAKACETYGLAHLELSRSALRAAESTEWPGNIRELDHAVQKAVIFAAGEGAKQVERTHLFPDAAAAEPAEAGPLTFQEATRKFQKTLLSDTLDATDWNIAETARRLHLVRQHIYNLIEAFGLTRRTEEATESRKLKTTGRTKTTKRTAGQHE